MRVLVTGATGYVGRHVVEVLKRHGHSVSALVRNRDCVADSPWLQQGVRIVPGEMKDSVPDDVVQSTDALLHLAWSGLPNYQELFHFEDVLPLHCRFLKDLVTKGCRRMLVTGTCLEYGMQCGRLTESTEARPITSYGLAKDSLRKYLEMLGVQLPFTLQWARLFYSFGPGQSQKSLLAQLDRALTNDDSEFNMSRGEQLRDYLPIEEVARRLVVLVEHPDAVGITNICSGVPISVRRLVEEHLATRNRSMRLNLGHFGYPEYEPLAFWGHSDRYFFA